MPFGCFHCPDIRTLYNQEGVEVAVQSLKNISSRMVVKALFCPEIRTFFDEGRTALLIHCLKRNIIF
jgi:hypothetical protein